MLAIPAIMLKVLTIQIVIILTESANAELVEIEIIQRPLNDNEN